GRVEALADALGRLAADGELRRRMGEESRRLAPTQDVSVTVGAVLRALLQLRPRFRERWRDVPESVFETIPAPALGLPVPDVAMSIQENCPRRSDTCSSSPSCCSSASPRWWPCATGVWGCSCACSWAASRTPSAR